jgi:hypothetical protein
MVAQRLMRVSDLPRLYDYNYWATDKLFGVVSQLTPEQFTWRSRRKLWIGSQHSRSHHERRVGLARSCWWSKTRREN